MGDGQNLHLAGDGFLAAFGNISEKIVECLYKV